MTQYFHSMMGIKNSYKDMVKNRADRYEIVSGIVLKTWNSIVMKVPKKLKKQEKALK